MARPVNLSSAKKSSESIVADVVVVVVGGGGGDGVVVVGAVVSGGTPAENQVLLANKQLLLAIGRTTSAAGLVVDVRLSRLQIGLRDFASNFAMLVADCCSAATTLLVLSACNQTTPISAAATFRSLPAPPLRQSLAGSETLGIRLGLPSGTGFLPPLSRQVAASSPQLPRSDPVGGQGTRRGRSSLVVVDNSN